MIESIHSSWNDWFQNPEWIVPICHAEAQYLHPIKAGKQCLIELQVTAVSHSSFTLTSLIYQEQEEKENQQELQQQKKLCCRVKTVHLFCDRKSRQKISVPQAIRDAITR